MENLNRGKIIMYQMLDGHYETVNDAILAVLKHAQKKHYQGVSKINFLDCFRWNVIRQGDKISFDLYCVAEVYGVYKMRGGIKMAVVIEAERWPKLLNYRLWDENQFPFAADAPPHILGQLDTAMSPTGEAWRGRCMSGPPWNYVLNIHLGSDGYEYRLEAEREFQSEMVLQGVEPNKLKMERRIEVFRGLYLSLEVDWHESPSHGRP